MLRALPATARLGKPLNAGPLNGPDFVRNALISMPVLFEFEALPVRVVTEEDGEHRFCTKDICAIPGYRNSRQVISDNCREKGVSRADILTKKRKQELQY